MKKSNLVEGIVYLLVGALFLFFTIWGPENLQSIFCGFAGGSLSCGIVFLVKYGYWSRPQNAEKYRKKQEENRINAQDERKEMLRNKSGRYAYLLGLLLLCVSIVLFAILGEMQVIGESRIIIIYLYFLLIVQIIAGILFYRRLSKKY